MTEIAATTGAVTEPAEKLWVTPEVRAELAKRWDKAESKSSLPLVFIGIVSVALFVGGESLLGGVDDFTWVGWLVVVIALHEGGHLLAMRLFGFSDLSVFFIPFVGAAAMGKKVNATPVERALVSLAGPVPGVLAASALLPAVVEDWQSNFGVFVTLLLVVNLLNMLPVGPLDGGRFFDVVLFSRKPLLRGVTQVGGGLMLGVVAYALSSWLLGIIALFPLVTVRVSVGSLAAGQSIRASLGDAAVTSARVPDEHFERVASLVSQSWRSQQTQLKKPSLLAGLIITAWREAKYRPPSVRSTVLLLCVYFGTFLAAPVLFVLGALLLGWTS